MKLIEFGESTFPIEIEVKRNQGDENNPLGLSEEAIDSFLAHMTEAFKAAMLDAFDNKKLLPRGVRLRGVFSITGVKMPNGLK